MDLDFRCEVGKIDIRDYSLIDALKQIGQERGEDLKFALWDYNIDPNLTKPFAVYNQTTLAWERYDSEAKALQGLKASSEKLKSEPDAKLKTLIVQPFKIFNPKAKNPDWEQFSTQKRAINKLQRLNPGEYEADLKKQVFRQYPVTITSTDANQEITPTSVFIPLNFRSTAFSVELKDGKIILKDGQNNEVGCLELEKEGENWKGVKILPTTPATGVGNEFGGQLVVSQSGQLILKPALQDSKLLLGQGFRAYEMDTNDWSPVEDQAPAHLCAANAGVALLEYFERMTDGRHLNASRLFLHKAACNLANLAPTSGVSVRSVVSALSVFGVPPETSWPYDLTKLEEEPSAWCYAQARNFRASSYLRLDRPGIDKTALIAQAKVFIYSGLPVIFGFSIHESVDQSWQTVTSEQLLNKLQNLQSESSTNLFQHHIQRWMNPETDLNGAAEDTDPTKVFYRAGDIPFPTFSELYRGGHAAIAIGYNDNKVIVNSNRLRASDREKLLGQNVKAFLLNPSGHFEEYTWNPGAERYLKVEAADSTQPPSFDDFEFMQDGYNVSSGFFILLRKQQTITTIAAQNYSPNTKFVLTPRDILLKNRSPLFMEGIRSNLIRDIFPTHDGAIEEFIVEEYLATKGAFKIRNSWGESWGEKGYGWLPYTYVYQDLTFDWWSILKFEWMNTEQFGLLRQANDLTMCNQYTSGQYC